MELYTVLKKLRNHDKLVQSMELFEVFKGLRKHYKYDYINTLEASIDTEHSIIEEMAEPVPPAKAPY